MMSAYYESLFNFHERANSSTALFPSFGYSSASSLFQWDSSVQMQHEALFRNIFSQYFQVPTPAVLTPVAVMSNVSVVEKESHGSLTTGNLHLRKSPAVSPSNLKCRRRLSCSQCSYTTNRLNNLKRHIQTMHEILSEPIDCCDRLFISKAHFRAHVNTEHRCGYHCDTCRRTFGRKALLRRHQSIHSGQKAFLCPRCSYSTSHKGNLDRHIRVHRNQNERQDFLT